MSCKNRLLGGITNMSVVNKRTGADSKGSVPKNFGTRAFRLGKFLKPVSAGPEVTGSVPEITVESRSIGGQMLIGKMILVEASYHIRFCNSFLRAPSLNDSTSEKH